MKKICVMVATVLLGSMVANAQTLYDANRFMGSDLNGTARYVGMGGAMGALGGDISTTATNPAGIGLFRKSDVMVTFGVQNVSSKSDFLGNSNTEDKTRATFDNIGIVFTNPSNNGALKYLNFAINYHRSKCFTRDMLMAGNIQSSQTWQVATMTPTSVGTSDLENDEAYLNTSIPWLGILNYNAHLINPAYQTKNGTSTFVGYTSFNNGESVDASYRSRERGGIDNVDFNMAFNLSDRFYIGATISAYNIDYDLHSWYGETFYANQSEYGNKDDGYYTLENKYNVDGDGVDFKLGFICRPVEESPFRFGIAVHTPTWYHITEHQMAYLDHDTFDAAGKEYKGTSFPYDGNGNEMESETKYRIVTPWKFNFSTGYTFGNVAALGLEYEYADYSSASMRDYNDDKMDFVTNTISNMMNAVHTFRAGFEYRIVPEVAFRLGYNYISASMKNDAYKQLANYAVRTDTEYMNTKDINNFSFGLGFHSGSFYCDMAYVYSNRKADFYPFNASNSKSNNIAKTKMTDSSSHAILTLGYRF
jgi:hypothetical protein